MPLFGVVAALGSHVACGSEGGPLPSTYDGGPLGDGGPLNQQPATATCGDAGASCVSGTASVRSLSTPQRYVAMIYDGFPLGGPHTVAIQEVAKDGTWAFPGLSDSTHYYVQIVAVFGESSDGGGGSSVEATVGPLTVPPTGPVPIVIKPVQLTVQEATSSSGALEVQSALAYVFDSATGALSKGGDTVSIQIGGKAVPMQWTQVATNTYAYYAALPSATPAQSTYSISTGSSTWSLVGTTPTFTPSLTAPAAGATVTTGQPIAVTWAAQPASDEEIVYLYTQSAGSWTASGSPVFAGPGATATTIPGGDVVAGPLLVQTAFLVGSCPASSDGCVLAEAMASQSLTAK
jgi:hypothetical protein